LYGSNFRVFETGYEFLKNVSLRISEATWIEHS